MKKHIFIIILMAGMICSCNDFLDREPLSSVPTDKYLLAESDLADYSANLYGQLPSHGLTYNLGVFSTDNNSDNQASTTPNDLFVKGQNRVPQSGGSWDFGPIRNINYFINRVRPNIEAGVINGNKENLNHYLGEMYFFRALVYFKRLQSLGDFPIIKQWVTEEYNVVREASKRRPRNEVARFILQDLDSAAYLMKKVAPMSNRLNKDCAYILKSRVGLYEGTWEKYHAGTARVPGGPGWPGANADYLKGFTIDISAESRFFLDEAVKAAQIVADARSLSDNYEGLFNSLSLNGVNEVILWRKYDATLTPSVSHHVVGYIQRDGGGNTGYTHSMIQTFIMESGLPIYATNSGYKGDDTFEHLADGRDPRLGYATILPGEVLSNQAAFNEYVVNGKGILYRPSINSQAEYKCPTGYPVKKGLTPDPSQGPTRPSITACVVYRTGEAYLNYMEAQFERDGSLDANSLKYWQAIRTRAGVSTDIDATIHATDLSKENDLACYSGNTQISPTLYNIRRERRVELIAEGFRLEDLKRWRALDKMQNYITQGFNLWDHNYQLYSNPSVNVSVIGLNEYPADKANVSSKSDGIYLCPYRSNGKNLAFNGYNWNPAKYLDPIAFDHFRLTTSTPGSPDYTSSTIYQNPGWKIETSSLPEGE